MNTNEIFNMYFGIIEDKRDPYTIKHELIDILKLVMIAILCGMDELDKIVDYGNNKQEFLEKEGRWSSDCGKRKQAESGTKNRRTGVRISSIENRAGRKVFWTAFRNHSKGISNAGQERQSCISEQVQ